jgi:predicted RNA-binding Zn-ribbon protein involved in translation (DUF1610 family)
VSRRKKTSRRYCEECGKFIESKRPEVFLCKECSEALARRKQRVRKNRKAFRQTQRLLDEQWSGEESGGG